MNNPGHYLKSIRKKLGLGVKAVYSQTGVGDSKPISVFVRPGMIVQPLIPSRSFYYQCNPIILVSIL